MQLKLWLKNREWDSSEYLKYFRQEMLLFKEQKALYYFQKCKLSFIQIELFWNIPAKCRDTKYSNITHYFSQLANRKIAFTDKRNICVTGTICKRYHPIEWQSALCTWRSWIMTDTLILWKILWQNGKEKTKREN